MSLSSQDEFGPEMKEKGLELCLEGSHDYSGQNIGYKHRKQL